MMWDLGQREMRIPWLLLLSLSACLDATPELDETQLALSSSWPATPEMVSHAAVILSHSTPICSGTLIASRWVLTARRCNVQTTHAVGLYSDNAGYTSVHSIVSVVHPLGTSATDFTDAAGVFADFTLVEIAPIRTFPPMLAWNSVLAGLVGDRVGSGTYSHAPNPNGALRRRQGITSTKSQGSFLLDDARASSGDAGGPFYLDDSVSGVSAGTAVNSSGTTVDRYTSVPDHLHFILQTIGWSWSGTPPQFNKRGLGTLYSIFTQTEDGCQYACEQTQCVAYSHHGFTQECRLFSTITSLVSSTDWSTATL